MNIQSLRTDSNHASIQLLDYRHRKEIGARRENCGSWRDQWLSHLLISVGIVGVLSFNGLTV